MHHVNEEDGFALRPVFINVLRAREYARQCRSWPLSLVHHFSLLRPPLSCSDTVCARLIAGAGALTFPRAFWLPAEPTGSQARLFLRRLPLQAVSGILFALQVCNLLVKHLRFSRIFFGIKTAMLQRDTISHAILPRHIRAESKKLDQWAIYLIIAAVVLVVLGLGGM